jgi:hypothetical protein
MVPRRYIEVASLPLLPNGKLARDRLPQLDQEIVTLPRLATPPRDQCERALAGIWCSVLECPRVGIHDDFFESGGNSLTAWQLMARIRKQFAVRLPVATLFANPTIAGLARVLVEEGAGDCVAPICD